MHINAIGGDCPGKTEIDPAIVRPARVVVEYEAQSRIEGEIQQMGDDFPGNRALAGTRGQRRPDGARPRKSRFSTLWVSRSRISRPCATSTSLPATNRSAGRSSSSPSLPTRAISSAASHCRRRGPGRTVC